MPSAPAIDVIPTGAALGAEIHGVDLRSIDDATFRALYQAWLDHSVVLVRGQQLSDDDLIAFSRRFGTLDHAPIQENGRRFVEGHPEIYVVSNVVENGTAIGSLGAGEAVWHTDMSYLPDPPKASALYALEVPASGGDTYFCTMYGGWDALPEDMREVTVCRAWARACGRLEGTTNVQGRAAAERGSVFVHVELSNSVRADAARRAVVVEALAAAAQ